MKERLRRILSEMLASNPALPFLAGNLFRSLFDSLSEEQAWRFAEGFLQTAERIYLEMQEEKRTLIIIEPETPILPAPTERQ